MRPIIALILLLGLLGCAATPSSQLGPARQALEAARLAGAAELAAEEYGQASTHLAEGEELSRRGKTEGADRCLRQAAFWARRAEVQADAVWDSIRVAFDEVAAGDVAAAAAQAEESEEAQAVESGRQLQAVQKASAPAKSKKLKRPPLPKKYIVRGGETLWTIAARRPIYRDALLWPLIYRANRDQIKDPRQIYPKQVLTIPRSVSREEMAAAREQARKSEVFPVEVLLRRASVDVE